MKPFDPKCTCGHRLSEHHRCASGPACCLDLHCEMDDPDWDYESDPRCPCGRNGEGGFSIDLRSVGGRRAAEKVAKKRGRARIPG